MTSVDPQQAAAALSDIEIVVRRVRQSQIYNLASLIMIMWGGLTFAGYLVTYLSPRSAGYGWPAVYVAGIAGLWVGHAFVAIGLCISALTLIGYFFVGDAFDLWMAFVNGGGLMLGGLWMRRS